MNNSVRCKFEVLDEEKYCSEIASIPVASFIKKINNYGIILTDRVPKTTDLLYEYSYDEVTGNKKQLQGVLVCIETCIGWTIMGETDESETKDMNNIIA